MSSKLARNDSKAYHSTGYSIPHLAEPSHYFNIWVKKNTIAEDKDEDFYYFYPSSNPIYTETTGTFKLKSNGFQVKEIREKAKVW